VQLEDLPAVVSCLPAAAAEALERSVRATVLHVDVGDAPVLDAIARDLELDEPGRNWNWDAISDLLWQRLHGGGDALLVLARADDLAARRLQELVDAAGALRDLSRTLQPVRLWSVLAGEGPAFDVK
jgi:hypothetical protein